MKHLIKAVSVIPRRIEKCSWDKLVDKTYKEGELFVHDLEMDNTRFIDCTFQNINLNHCRLNNVVFDNCTFSEAFILYSAGNHVLFKHCKGLIGIKFCSLSNLRVIRHDGYILFEYAVIRDGLLEHCDRQKIQDRFADISTIEIRP